MANGIIIIDKPAGWTSMDVCAKLRGILKTKKVGHAGTLDPMATGVLPVFVGQATRAVSFAEDGEKEYIAGLRLGRTTDTQDISGETLDTHPVLTGREDLLHLLPRFTGEIQQVPPMYSAVKIGGQKLYQIARRGGEIERPARPVTVYELELLDQTGPGDYTLRIRCSKGTYVRTLCHDIGQALGCGGCPGGGRDTGPGPGGGRGAAGPAGLTVPPAPGLPDPATPGGRPVPQREPLHRPPGAAGGRVPGIWSERRISLPQPPGGRRNDLP